jgi:hypothetical protein
MNLEDKFESMNSIETSFSKLKIKFIENPVISKIQDEDKLKEFESIEPIKDRLRKRTSKESKAVIPLNRIENDLKN